MHEDDQTRTEQEAGFTDWDKLINEQWKTWSEPWGGMLQNLWPQGKGQEQGKGQGRVAESLNNSFKMWQTMMGNMITPTSMENLQKISTLTPEISLGFAETCLQGFNSVQKQASEWIIKRGATLSAADIQDLDNELLKNLKETYEKEFSRYLKLPQLGMGRLYQERAMQAVDKMNVLQFELSEFIHMLYMPIEKSLNSLQKEIVEMADAGSFDEKSKTYYNLWIKLLEGHYMELFKQPEYTVAMGKALKALQEFVDAKQTVINDVLKQMNIPTNQDLDELSKEIYLLKKRVRLLEKK